jgi:Transposase DNA-binding/Transposase Tn5 dimerisation domain
MISWAMAELTGAELGDIRLDERLVRIVERLSERPEASIPQACGSAAETKAAYRFWDNDAVSPEGILQPHRQRTIERSSQHPIVLAVQDTTEIDLSSHAATEGLGYLGSPSARGLLVHNVLCVSPDGTPLGLLDQFVWTRLLEERGKRYTRNARATSEKESQRWLDGLTSVQRHLSHHRCVVLVGDRESDLFDLFASPRAQNIRLLVRIRDRRRLVRGPVKHLGSAVSQSPPRATTILEVPRADDRPSRRARLTLRWTSLTIERPVNHPNRSVPNKARLWFVEAREENPPAGTKPLSWLLATSWPVATRDEAIAVLRWYAYRWRIERFHYVLKSGCGIERHQLATRERTERLLATLSIVAWHILHLAYEARHNPNLPCTRVFSDDQWRVLHLAVHQREPLPDDPPLMVVAIRDCARLGGYLGRKRDGPPGVKTLWRGWKRLSDLLSGYTLALNHVRTLKQDEDYG